MKSGHYSWWPYVREIVRSYGGGGNGPLSGAALADYEAVARAVADTERLSDGQDRLRLIRLVYWDRTQSLDGVAMEVPCGRATAFRWQRQFFETVARHRGLLDLKR